MKASAAFAPGHVSGLFAVHDEWANALAKGSRGAGWSLDKGATALARPGSGQWSVDGVAHAPVTRRALDLLDPRTRELDIRVRLALPVSQGFGMSAAGSLAACLAAADQLGLDGAAALAATHQAEVESGTGLGDAIGSWLGGVEVRVAPGIPPHGGAVQVAAAADFLFCVLGDAIATPAVIRDDAWKRRTRAAGDGAVDRILAAGKQAAWPAILAESHAFSLALGLMPATMRRVGERLPSGVSWGQCMLGNTLWATGPASGLADARPILAAAGSVLDAAIDPHGARLVRP
ncbi:MAG: hypothetical protein V4510_11235 [bacterium]